MTSLGYGAITGAQAEHRLEQAVPSIWHMSPSTNVVPVALPTPILDKKPIRMTNILTTACPSVSVFAQRAPSAMTLTGPNSKQWDGVCGGSPFLIPELSGSFSGRAGMNDSFLLFKIQQRHRAQQDLVWRRLGGNQRQAGNGARDLPARESLFHVFIKDNSYSWFMTSIPGFLLRQWREWGPCPPAEPAECSLKEPPRPNSQY